MARDKKPDPEARDVCRNRRAFHEYEVSDTLECGLVLTGTEVKSLRAGQASIEEAYGRIDANELWLLNCDIPEYAMGNQMNHKPRRARKLLVHRREIANFAGKASIKGFTLIPLRLYFKGGKAKLELAVCRGKQLHDKRQDLKKKDADREIRRAMTDRRKR
jgi:SsrA-binding protein